MFDHNRVAPPTENYVLERGNGWSMADDQEVCGVVVSNVNANHCEVFVDKAYTLRADYVYNETVSLVLYLKVLLDRLDGQLQRVVFFGQRQDVEHGVSDEWRPTLVDQQADDYYKLVLPLVTASPSGPTTYRYKGAIYAETDLGTRYWINPAGQQTDFVLDINLADDLQAAHGQAFDATQAIDLDSVAKTVDTSAYLNPGGCR